MSGDIGVFAQYSDGEDEWPPVGEVVMRLGERRILLSPENAEIVGKALLLYSSVARDMTQDMIDHPGLAVGSLSTRSGYLQ